MLQTQSETSRATPAAVNTKDMRADVEMLVASFAAVQTRKIEFGESLKAVAERHKLDSGVLRRFIAAQADFDRRARLVAQTEQLQLLLDSTE